MTRDEAVSQAGELAARFLGDTFAVYEDRTGFAIVRRVRGDVDIPTFYEDGYGNEYRLVYGISM